MAMEKESYPRSNDMVIFFSCIARNPYLAYVLNKLLTSKTCLMTYAYVLWGLPLPLLAVTDLIPFMPLYQCPFFIQLNYHSLVSHILYQVGDNPSPCSS